MLWQLDPSAPTPLHAQIAASARRAIADGELASGERLPPAAELGAVLGVNPNTVLQAYRTLRDEGLLEFRRGRGVRVVDAPSSPAALAAVTEAVHRLRDLGRRHGYPPEELARLLLQDSPEPAGQPS